MPTMSERLEHIAQSIKNASTLGTSFLCDVALLIESFGYALIDGDELMLAFYVQKVENRIKQACNTPCVPDGLRYTAVEMVAAEFLLNKKGAGKLNLEAINFDAIIQQLQEGDISISYSDGSQTPEQRFDTLLGRMIDHGGEEFVCYRQLKW